MARFSKRKQRAYRRQFYSSNKEKALELRETDYKCNADLRKASERESYGSKPSSKKRTMQKYNALNSR